MISDKHQKKIALLGATGSIGTQTLDIIDKHPDLFQVEVLTAHNQWEMLIQQAKKFQPNCVVISNEYYYEKVKDALKSENIKVFTGANAIASIVEMDTLDMVVNALVGYAGLKPTINAINAKKTIALANKETLVVAGAYITELATQKGVSILPIDSEHSAIFQCIVGEFDNAIDKIILTASGGPFRDKTLDFIKKATKKQALQHPNWEMGNKITIDSATMMNKGFEVLEAKWLFGLKKDQIEVIVHPESIIHSMVQFEDQSLKAQLGMPDMRIPIQYALSYPKRLKANFKTLDFSAFSQLTFEKPDFTKFPCLSLAYDALDKGGNFACTLNASNEIAVQAFLEEKIHFLEIYKVIEETLEKVAYIRKPNLEDYVNTDTEARKIAQEIIQSRWKHS